MKKKTKINPQVFRDAAVLVHKRRVKMDDFCCWAINSVLHKNRHNSTGPYHEYLSNVLKPESAQYVAWYCTDVDGLAPCDDTMELINNARIIGLLLCAQLAKEGYEP